VNELPIQQLIDVIGRLTHAHKALLTLAEQKKNALIGNHVDEVSAITNKETRISRTIDQLLKEQADATNAFFRSKGFQPTRAITVTELSRLIAEPELKDELLRAREALLATIELLATANQLNQQMIQQSLSFVNYSIDLVVGPDEDPVYRNPLGQGNVAAKRTGYFDSRA
jgi:flagellar biosynthesis/type III secretory pathway chaperone